MGPEGRRSRDAMYQASHLTVQVAMTSNWQSSPVRGKSSVNDVQNNQISRASTMRYPMSSPLRSEARQSAKDRMKQELKILRDKVRDAKIELGREKRLHEEDAQKRIDDMEAQAAVLATDLDLLIEEESGPDADPSAEDASDEYDQELEEYLAQEELELEAQLKELSLL